MSVTRTFDESLWRLCPVEPTEKMLRAMDDGFHGDLYLVRRRRTYAQVLAAAPSPEQKGESVQPVAWGMPNTAITGRKQALMMVRLEIPSNDQYGGAKWIPLFASVPEQAVVEKMKELAGEWRDEASRKQKLGLDEYEAFDYCADELEKLIKEAK